MLKNSVQKSSKRRQSKRRQSKRNIHNKNKLHRKLKSNISKNAGDQTTHGNYFVISNNVKAYLMKDGNTTEPKNGRCIKTLNIGEYVYLIKTVKKHLIQRRRWEDRWASVLILYREGDTIKAQKCWIELKNLRPSSWVFKDETDEEIYCLGKFNYDNYIKTPEAENNTLRYIYRKNLWNVNLHKPDEHREILSDTHIPILRNIENKGLRPNISVMNKLNEYSNLQLKNTYIKENMERCKVYYDSSDGINEVKRLVYDREPGNKNMTREYDPEKFEKFFGYKCGYYETYDKPKLPSNILIYTPIHYKDLHTIHVLNAIGLALDDESRYDYKYLKDKPNKNEIAINFYENLFKKIYLAARNLNKSKIILSQVGIRNFKDELWEGFKKNIWDIAYQKTESYQKDNNLTVNIIPKQSIKELFPDLNENTLYVNDCGYVSIPGYGSDETDRELGRDSDIGVNGTSLTNPFLTINKNYIPLNISEPEVHRGFA